MKTLLVMRHAKSDWDAPHDTDHDRPLNDRGVRSARVMGKVLAERGMAPQHVISSTAVRARTTAELAAESGDWDCSFSLDSGLYESGVEGVIAITAAAPEVERLMIVGHQPTWSMLVAHLTGEHAEMKTAAVAVIEFGIEAWRDLPGATGSMLEVFQPRAFLG